jgi:hydroxymethylbilane synthase
LYKVVFRPYFIVMTTKKIRIGTRASKLALWQAYFVEDLLKKAGFETEIDAIETKGDKIQNQSLSSIGTKGLFTEELEEKLRTGENEIAVHSAKDVPSELLEGMEIIAFTEREKPNDVLVSLNPDFSLDDTSAPLVVGSSSTRRKAILRKNYPHVQIVDARGNLQTRFRKMEEGNFQAMLLAYAGIHRMEYDERIVKIFPLTEFTPAVGQGTIALEASTGLAADVRERIRAAVNHVPTEYCLRGERAFLKKLQGGCSVPVFALGTLQGDTLVLRGGVISLDGQEALEETLEGPKETAEQLGLQLAERLLQRGAGKILEEIKSQKNKS